MAIGSSKFAEFNVGKNYLLMIGIDDYLHFPKLANAVKDTIDVSNTLLQYYHFEQENCTILINTDASRNNIFNAFRKAVQTLTEEDSIIIYYSGHGGFDEDTRQGYWIPYDADNSHASFIENATIISFTNAIKAKHIFLIADTSFAGSLIIEPTKSEGTR
jgi:uncharacterized caspase-like protein